MIRINNTAFHSHEARLIEKVELKRPHDASYNDKCFEYALKVKVADDTLTFRYYEEKDCEADFERILKAIKESKNER